MPPGQVWALAACFPWGSVPHWAPPPSKRPLRATVNQPPVWSFLAIGHGPPPPLVCKRSLNWNWGRWFSETLVCRLLGLLAFWLKFLSQQLASRLTDLPQAERAWASNTVPQSSGWELKTRQEILENLWGAHCLSQQRGPQCFWAYKGGLCVKNGDWVRTSLMTCH